MLLTELRALVERLAALARPVASWLVPGVGAAAVEETLGEMPPEEVIMWFGWCNGVELQPGQIQDDINVVPGYAPLSLAEAARFIESYSGDPVLGDHWVPVLGGAGGDIYAAVWGPNGNVRVAGVLVGEETEVEFGSLENMVAVFNECYRRGAFFVDGRGRLTMDANLYDEVYEVTVR
ncbi:hypothetical protein [Saccharothrix sp. NRRL B-16314]|uniref:hypothetical protein n=1 Tax=Saccharothrix sp. NRRL B-16314 TaxID=1463825 RepID=UPI0005265016|nr:hypothetical protein [Saccharothrix sp. NRRL B-16314]